VTIKFHLLVETEGAVAVGSSAVLGVIGSCATSSIKDGNLLFTGQPVY
jgi:hypothetical protein